VLRASISRIVAVTVVLAGLAACTREDAMRSVEVDVVAVLPPEDSGRELLTPVPRTVHVNVRGPRAAVDAIDELQTIELDLRAAPPRLQLSPLVRAPQGVTVVSVTPAAIDLGWDEFVIREVPVKVEVIGWPADGFGLRGEPSSDPPTVRVRGPKAPVEALRSVEAGPLDVNNLPEGAHVQRVTLAPAPDRVRFEASSVEAKFEVVPTVAPRRRR
jgi:YbbR domain-containing protein